MLSESMLNFLVCWPSKHRYYMVFLTVMLYIFVGADQFLSIIYTCFSNYKGKSKT